MKIIEVKMRCTCRRSGWIYLSSKFGDRLKIKDDGNAYRRGYWYTVRITLGTD